MVQGYIFHFFAGPPLRRTAFRWTAPPLDFVFSSVVEISLFLLSLEVFAWTCGSGSKPWPTQTLKLGGPGLDPRPQIPREDLQREKNDICGAFFLLCPFIFCTFLKLSISLHFFKFLFSFILFHYFALVFFTFVEHVFIVEGQTQTPNSVPVWWEGCSPSSLSPLPNLLLEGSGEKVAPPSPKPTPLLQTRVGCSMQRRRASRGARSCWGLRTTDVLQMRRCLTFAQHGR